MLLPAAPQSCREGPATRGGSQMQVDFLDVTAPQGVATWPQRSVWFQHQQDRIYPLALRFLSYLVYGSREASPGGQGSGLAAQKGEEWQTRGPAWPLFGPGDGVPRALLLSGALLFSDHFHLVTDPHGNVTCTGVFAVTPQSEGLQAGSGVPGPRPREGTAARLRPRRQAVPASPRCARV